MYMECYSVIFLSGMEGGEVLYREPLDLTNSIAVKSDREVIK